MKKFVSSGHHSSLLSGTILSNILFVSLLCLSIFIGRNFDTQLFVIIFTLAVALFTNFSIFKVRKCGLYIDDKNFYDQGFFTRRKINLNDISAIRKSESAVNTKFGTRLIKDEHGNQMYSAIFIKGSVPNFKPNYNDIDIMMRYRKQVMFKTIYDKEAIDYILTLNPNIKLL